MGRSLRSSGLVFFVLLMSCGGERPERYEKAPIVLISVDTLRSDRLPVYGYTGVATPAIDALARDSIVFERAYSHCPMTLPAHLSAFTGLLPTEHGVRNNIGYRFDREKFRTIAEILRERGYATGAAVSSYVLRSETGADDGFDFYDDAIPVATAGATSEHQRSGAETLRLATQWIAANAEKPFFFFFHIYEPHAPYAPPEPFKSRYSNAYDGEVAASDAVVGQFIASLKRAGVYDRAVVVFLSDHGEGLWEHGEDQHGILLYRESLQIPLFVKLPNSSRRGTRVGEAAPLAGVFHTVLDLVGMEQRQSLLRTARAEPIYAETLYPRIHLGWSELRSLIDGRYHYIESSSPELYDLQSDPGEKKNIISDQRRVAADLRRALAQMPAALGDIERVDPEDAAKLAALGYVGTPQNRTGPLPNPREAIGELETIKKAFSLAEARRYDEAKPILRELVAKNPRLLDVWSRLGEVLLDEGRYDEAIRTYTTALQQAARFSPDLVLAIAAAQLKNGQLDEAARHAAAAVNAYPREAHELLARIALQRRDLAEAEKQGRLALEAGDRQPATLLLLAEVQRAAGQLEAALRTVEEAQRRIPRLAGAWHLRGDLLARLDRPEEAIAAYRREITEFPRNLQAYANLAVIYMIQENRAAANAVLQQMTSTNPHRGAYLLAERTLEAFGDKRGAARWRERAAP